MLSVRFLSFWGFDKTIFNRVVMMPRFSLLFFLLITSLVSAEKYALLVGINDYQGDISPLRYCVTDMEAFRDALVESVNLQLCKNPEGLTDSVIVWV